jgi:glutathione peroxidase
VNGKDTAPVYKYLKAQKSGSLGSRRIKWNFTKFLVDEKGHVIQRYSPTTQPFAIEVLFIIHQLFNELKNKILVIYKIRGR